MAFSSKFPDVNPSLHLDFANTIALDPRITFSRASVGTYIGSDKLIKIAPAGVARFQYDSVTGDSLGLLVEESRTNLLTYSEQFDNAIWSKNNISITANTGTAPDGTLSADTMTGLAGTSVKYTYQQYTTTTTGAYVTSIWLQYISEQFVVVRMNDNTGSNGSRVIVDLISGTLGATSTDGTATNVAATIKSFRNGWYYVTLTCTFTSALTSIQGASVFLTGYTTTASTGSVRLWGAQLEAGAFATSYIPTIASTVIRQADAASITGTNFSSWYNPAEGTVVIGAKRGYSGNFVAYPNLAAFDDGTSNNIMAFYGALNSVQFTNYSITSGGVLQTIYAALNVPTTDPFTMVQTLATNVSTFGGNGVLTATDTSVTMPIGINRLRIGPSWTGTISKLVYYPRRLSNTQLQALSS